MTVRTSEGPKSLIVDLNDLKSLGRLMPVRKTSVMPGVPHYEFEKKLTKTKSEPLFRQNPFGFTGKEYGKSFDNDSKIPVRKKKVSIDETKTWKKPPAGKSVAEKREEFKRRHSFGDTTNRDQETEEELGKSKSLDYTINE